MSAAPKLAFSPSSEPILSPQDVSKLTGFSVETLAQWRSQKKEIPYIKLARNKVGYLRRDLDNWLSARIVRVELHAHGRR
jgi:predicted DNA-binding transcriptional regulator AlpA